MTYAEKLKNPRWQKKRLEVLQRDDFTCLLCGSKDDELHVHHKDYHKGAEPWEYDLENFQTLCYHCHIAVTVIQVGLSVAKVTKFPSIDAGFTVCMVRYVSEDKNGVAIMKVNNSDRSWVQLIGLDDMYIRLMSDLIK